MGSVLGKIFVDVSTLPNDAFGFIQLMYIGLTYAFVLMQSSKMISEGSELLLLIPAYAGVVGSIVLPVLGAVPDGAIVLFSGLGPNAQEEVSVGVGALAGSTIMLLTVPWALALIAGRVNLDKSGDAEYVKPKNAPKDWTKLPAGGGYTNTGISVSPLIKYTAKIMLVTAIPFLIIQVPALYNDCAMVADEKQCKTSPMAALIGGISAVALFCFYLWDQARIANTDTVRQDMIDQIRASAIDRHQLSLRGLFPTQVIDSEGLVHISADNKRFRTFLKPFFARFDTDKSGGIDKNEFGALVHSLGENPTKDELDVMMKRMDKDGSGEIDFDEFVLAMVELLTNIQIPDSNDIVEEKVEGDDDDAEDEEAEMPDDLADLSPAEQQSKLLKRSFLFMGIGVLFVLVFSDPMVDVLSELGARTGIRPFFVAFCLAPLASNASEFIAAYNYALKKTEKTITISISTLLGAACMNNTFCLAIFMMIVYAKNLKWVFSAETFSILVVELIMFVIAQKKTQPAWFSVFILALAPATLGLVSCLEAYGFD